MSGDANHARESALGELDRVRAGYETNPPSGSFEPRDIYKFYPALGSSEPIVILTIKLTGTHYPRYDEERRRREKELRERHQVVQIRRQMLERIKQREKMRQSLDGAAEEDMKVG